MARPSTAAATKLPVLGVFFVLAVVMAAPSPPSSPPAPAAPSSPAATEPKYVSDRVCAQCHREIAESYRETGMGRSMSRPRAAKRIEDFTSPPFDHAPSHQRLQIAMQGEGLVFRRWILDGAGRPGPVFEQPVDWVLGSGHRTRSYLYRTPDGALFQLPLEWYEGERRWAMAPGFDRPDHDGVMRRIRRECLFCHNAYPEPPVRHSESAAASGDGREAPHFFPAELPEGIGCQRCHGPGGAHVDAAMDDLAGESSVRAAIVNPARLAPRLRDDVCDQCHLLPLVALPGERRIGRGDYSYRPGTPLPDYLAAVDADEEGTGANDRFEIDHQSYRLRQSRCFLAGAARGQQALSCLTCHDPHRSVPPDERAARYRAACQACHAANACKRKRPAESATASEPAAASSSTDTSDCVSCHMPQRRPRDVVHVLMTDHRIQRPPDAATLRAYTAPRGESEPILTGVRALEPERLGSQREAEIARTLPLVRSGASKAAVDHLGLLLAKSPAGGQEDELRREWAAGLLRLRRYGEAAGVLEELAKRGAVTTRTLEWLGLARDGLGKAKEAEEALRAALARPDVERAEVAARLAQILLRQGRAEEAAVLLRQAVELRPNLVGGWLTLAAAQEKMGKMEEAKASRERALRLDPRLAVAPAVRAGAGG